MTDKPATAAGRATMAPAAHGYADALAGDHDDPGRYGFPPDGAAADDYRTGYGRGARRLEPGHHRNIHGYPPPTAADVAGWHSRFRNHADTAETLADLADEYANAPGGELVAAELRRAADNQSWSANYWLCLATGLDGWELLAAGTTPTATANAGGAQ